MFTPIVVHDLIHRVAGLDGPHGHWWMELVSVLALVVAPAWTGWMALRLAWRTLRERRRRGAGNPEEWRLERYVLRATLRPQLRLLLLSLLTLPAAWLLLEIPKHIINHALSDAEGDGHPGMAFLGLELGRVELLFALCASYLAVLTLGGLAKYAVNRTRGGLNERLVRRLRLAVFRRARGERSPERRAALAAVAVQEVEPIGYAGAGLVAVPLVQGGTLLISLAFLLLQDAALALAALVMLPVQLTLLPRLQRRLNAKVRERVHATRTLGGLLTAPEAGTAEHPPVLLRQMRQAEALERVRVEIADLKGRLKGLYNYTSNLTPFFFFSVGGYLVIQGRLSLGALVAALAAYKEISPALRELFDFAQGWSDARARFEEVTRALSFLGSQGWSRIPGLNAGVAVQSQRNFASLPVGSKLSLGLRLCGRRGSPFF
ncbi:ABC-type multidrug transport system fused ATPase/permease subunit [Methylobacterium gregans]|uniref:multidrug ABC transporter ATPase n=1 Tax=Methylobacterium gregans TaxID=374424 RepID=UPI00278ECCA8|nr:ABC-type multidrug transport system fused ATPase/permease subunit [Methylobacterium gregans]